MPAQKEAPITVTDGHIQTVQSQGIHRIPWLSSQDHARQLVRINTSWGLKAGATFETLNRAVQHFSRLPYENVSKILKSTRHDSLDDPRRLPVEVLTDHIENGFGGTCFSLTAFMESTLGLLGFETMRFLADTPQGSDMHAAVLIPMGNAVWLVDPGYLVLERGRIPDPPGDETVRGNIIVRRLDRNRGALFTRESDGTKKLRYTFKLQGDDPETFRQRWLDSFQWSSARSLILSKRDASGLTFMHDKHLRLITDKGISKENLGNSPGLRAHQVFGLPQDKIEEAFRIAMARKKEIKQRGRS